MIRAGAALSFLIVAAWIGSMLALRSSADPNAVFAVLWLTLYAIGGLLLAWVGVGLWWLLRAEVNAAKRLFGRTAGPNLDP
jgi:hypothetical protein